MILVSSCLLGISCRYDARGKPFREMVNMLYGRRFIPVCPEQLGGLSTPRTPARIVGGDGFDCLEGNAKVLTFEGDIDVTSAFLRGAEECLKFVKAFGVKKAFLKSESPSCGVGYPCGVTAAALMLNGVQIEEFN